MRVRGVAQVILLVVAVAVGCALAQDVVPEKHVKDISAEQSPGVMASALCERVQAAGRSYEHLRDVNPETLEKDLLERVS